MDFNLLRNFNRHERVALLQLIIKVAGSDNQITDEEQELINQFLQFNNLKITQEMISKAKDIDTYQIAEKFTSKSNMDRGYKLIESFAEANGINPDCEGRVLDEIKSTMNKCKAEIKFSLIEKLKTMAAEFSYLWGKEDLNPSMRLNMALFFTILACLLGSLYTNSRLYAEIVALVSLGPLGHWATSLIPIKTTSWVLPDNTDVIIGLLIYGALCSRRFVQIPNNFRNIVFCSANVYLLSIIAMFVVGRNGFEMTTTVAVFFGLILLAWLGLRELLGFVLIGFFILMLVKMNLMNTHMDWRAFPFILSAFFGIGFQSDNLFNDFSRLSGSFFKNLQIEKEDVREGLQLAGGRIKDTTNKAISTGKVAAKAYLG